MVDTTDKLLGKRVKSKSSILQPGKKIEAKKIKTRVLLKCIEDIDEVSVNEMIRII